MPQAGRFKAEFFKALAHPLRIAILDRLRGGACTVNDLSATLGVEQSSVSQQLAVLRGRDIVSGRKEGLNVFYSVNDRVIFELLDVARRIFNNQLVSLKGTLTEVSAPAQKGRR
jgi:DNA-binding transcriptional ArsR family regulator